MFDYTCCDFCPYNPETSIYDGTVCENCQAKACERKFMSMFADAHTEDDDYE